MTTLMPIQSAAMWYVDQVQLASEVGARSGFQSGLDETSSVNSTKSLLACSPVGLLACSARISLGVKSSSIILAFGPANLRVHHDVAAPQAAEILERRVAALLHELPHAVDEAFDHVRSDRAIEHRRRADLHGAAAEQEVVQRVRERA